MGGDSESSAPAVPPDQPMPQVHIAERGIVVQGLRLATAMSDAPRALLRHAPLVVLPAAGHSWSDYRPILERFATERRVFALDWPGFGGSAKPAPADFDYSSRAYAALLPDWLNALGLARMVLVGHSVGGAAALRYAAAHPERVAGLALVAPGGFTAPGVSLAVATRVLGTPAILRRVEPAVTSLYLGPTTPETQAIVARHKALRHEEDYAAFIQAYAALWRSFRRPDEQLAALAEQVSAPALVLRGALDPAVTAADARRASRAIGGADHPTLEVVLPEAGHLPFLQQREHFNDVLAGLLNTAEVNAAHMS